MRANSELSSQRPEAGGPFVAEPPTCMGPVADSICTVAAETAPVRVTSLATISMTPGLLSPLRVAIPPIFSVMFRPDDRSPAAVSVALVNEAFPPLART